MVKRKDVKEDVKESVVEQVETVSIATGTNVIYDANKVLAKEVKQKPE